METTQRQTYLDWLRIMSILGVLFFHSAIKSNKLMSFQRGEIVEHMCDLEALPEEGFKFNAVV